MPVSWCEGSGPNRGPRDEDREGSGVGAADNLCESSGGPHRDEPCRNLKHATQWNRTLATYVNPILGNVPVSEVTTDHVLRALKPIWHVKPETAVRVRGRIETVLAAAIARGWCQGPNAARRHNHPQMILPPRSKIAPVEPHASIPWQEVPTFRAALRNQNSVGAMALEFLILTAGRSGEVRGATWQEIDIESANWTVSAVRMKANREHAVPISPPALALLRRIAALGGPGHRLPGDARGAAAFRRELDRRAASVGPGRSHGARVPRVLQDLDVGRDHPRPRTDRSQSPARCRGPRGVRWPPKTGQVAKRESPLGTADWPEVRHGKYTEEAQP
jgi:Phage integrase family